MSEDNELSIEERFAIIKAKMKLRVAWFTVALAAVGTLGKVAAESDCTQQNKDTDENGVKIENVEENKTSAVFGVKQSNDEIDLRDHILSANGDELRTLRFDSAQEKNGVFLEPSNTVTDEDKDIKTVRNKGGHGKQLNFSEIAKIRKDRGR